MVRFSGIRWVQISKMNEQWSVCLPSSVPAGQPATGGLGPGMTIPLRPPQSPKIHQAIVVAIETINLPEN